MRVIYLQNSGSEGGLLEYRRLLCRTVWLTVCLFFVCGANGQRFGSTANYVDLPDFREGANPPHEVEISVHGLPDRSSSSFGIETVQLAIVHERISDIKVELENPDGLVVWLANRHGRDGANYTETIFTDRAFHGPVSSGRAPFAGSYLPDGQLSNFNMGQTLNGIWKLRVYDLEPGVRGKFGSVVLQFGLQPAHIVPPACGGDVGAGCVRPKKGKALLPDLALMPKVTGEEWREVAFDPAKGYGELRFAVGIMNIGYGPLEVKGTGEWYCSGKPVQGDVQCPDGSYPRQPMLQYVYIKRGRGPLQTRKHPAGYNAYDARPGHEHYHSDDFVDYYLIRRAISGSDTSDVVVGEGTKASFCIWDLNRCREDLANCEDGEGHVYTDRNLPNYGFGQFRDCDANRQGLSVGGVDYYGEDFEGQSILIPRDVPNGDYILRVILDPQGLFIESDKKNNLLEIPITLTKQNKSS